MIATILLQAGGFGVQQMIMLGAIALVFYFFMIRPQLKKQKDQKKYVEELKKGDKIITTAGMHGRVAEINDISVLIETEGGGKIRFDKSAISQEASQALNKSADTK